MTARPELEIDGNIFVHPFAEVLAEIACAELDGSLRASDKDRKCVLYFKRGRVVFAVSNARSSRLYDLLLRRKKVDEQTLSKAPSFVNDFELAAYLQDMELVTRADFDSVFIEQIEMILVDLLSWPEGKWTFSSLARIRDGLSYDIDSTKLLVDYGRCMAADKMLSRFRSLDEMFRRSDVPENSVPLKPEEAFVLSRAAEAPLSAASLTTVAAMPETDALQLIYTLWLGGLLIRDEWQPAFPTEVVTAMRSARLELKKEASMPIFTAPGVGKKKRRLEPQKPVDKPKPRREAKPKDQEVDLTVEQYLTRVENARTHYEVLGVHPKAEVAEIKRVYFGLARMFHPDKFHAEGGDLLRRVQDAFTELAQAHETLKDEANRELYNYRMRKELADHDARASANGNPNLQNEQAAESFERGLNLLIDGKAEESIPFLARAAHFAPKNARYRAFYGKALSSDETQRHKAESEMQAALRLDSNNPTFRLMLAEFFIEFNLKKRAEGELTRLLALFPNNREARDLLASLKA